MRLIASTLLLAVGFTASAAEPPTDQTKRGQKLFLNSPKGVACATCHQVGGAGTAIGPDLKVIASYAMPRGMVTAIQMSSTETVQMVTLANGTKFPARVVEKKADSYQLWNLSSVPPVLATFSVKDVASIERDSTWKHPPASAGYTDAELADIIGYLRWAATGNQKKVTDEEVGTSQ